MSRPYRARRLRNSAGADVLRPLQLPWMERWRKTHRRPRLSLLRKLNLNAKGAVLERMLFRRRLLLSQLRKLPQDSRQRKKLSPKPSRSHSQRLPGRISSPRVTVAGPRIEGGNVCAYRIRMCSRRSRMKSRWRILCRQQIVVQRHPNRCSSQYQYSRIRVRPDPSSIPSVRNSLSLKKMRLRDHNPVRSSTTVSWRLRECWRLCRTATVFSDRLIIITLIPRMTYMSRRTRSSRMH